MGNNPLLPDITGRRNKNAKSFDHHIPQVELTLSGYSALTPCSRNTKPEPALQVFVISTRILSDTPLKILGAVIRVQLLDRRAAPSNKRPHSQPFGVSLYCCSVAGQR